MSLTLVTVAVGVGAGDDVVAVVDGAVGLAADLDEVDAGGAPTVPLGVDPADPPDDPQAARPETASAATAAVIARFMNSPLRPARRCGCSSLLRGVSRAQTAASVPKPVHRVAGSSQGPQ
ncbi:hypothetical protein GCM10011492_10130 [Flexivirga endophytica]|uniref:Uncharacterized protein n=1 Tax=Flexivirga endophytica TaxID=1849103 RepID=A0A916SYG1_9MICO|nr:hypothetical protein GCM10011492_10130 [Flexivirga endophytica]GHB56264.1 hypothetical protein GCM10008112_26670 [Flexivirga endophytica]